MVSFHIRQIVATRPIGSKDRDSAAKRIGSHGRAQGLFNFSSDFCVVVVDNRKKQTEQIHAAKLTKHGDIDYEAICKLADGFNGADLRNVCTEVRQLLLCVVVVVGDSRERRQQ
jgi:hypothetical protein